MCGVCAIFDEGKASEKLFVGLFCLQHRGQDNAGMAVSNGQTVKINKDRGLVSEIFKPNVLVELSGHIGIGHTRYPTAGDNSVVNAQPMSCDTKFGKLAIVSNGDITNILSQTRFLKKVGFTPYSSNDAEVIVATIGYFLEKNGKMEYAIKKMMEEIKGSYSAALIFKDKLYLFRDPMGIRPYYLGHLDKNYAAVSETCALDTMGFVSDREINAGELITIGNSGLKSKQLIKSTKNAHCVFEHIYFSRPDSLVFGESVEEMRLKFGQRLGFESNVKADLVMPVPDSSNTQAIGFSQQTGIPFRLGLIRSHYVGRTFIGSSQAIRDYGVKLKFNPVKCTIKGQRVVVVDDSIVRGTTSKKLMKIIRNAGAKEIHLRIASPPIKHCCYYGIDTPRHNELIAANNSIAEMEKYLEVDSLKYLTLEGLKSCLSNPKDYCFACLNGKYPIKPPNTK